MPMSALNPNYTYLNPNPKQCKRLGLKIGGSHRHPDFGFSGGVSGVSGARETWGSGRRVSGSPCWDAV